MLDEKEILRVIKANNQLGVIANGTVPEIMSALSIAAASVFCSHNPDAENGYVNEEDLYEFLEKFCSQTKRFVEMRVEKSNQ